MAAVSMHKQKLASSEKSAVRAGCAKDCLIGSRLFAQARSWLHFAIASNSLIRADAI